MIVGVDPNNWREGVRALSNPLVLKRTDEPKIISPQDSVPHVNLRPRGRIARTETETHPVLSGGARNYRPLKSIFFLKKSVIS